MVSICETFWKNDDDGPHLLKFPTPRYKFQWEPLEGVVAFRGRYGEKWTFDGQFLEDSPIYRSDACLPDAMFRYQGVWIWESPMMAANTINIINHIDEGDEHLPPKGVFDQVSKDPESGEVIHSSGVRTESSIRVTKAFIHEIFRCHSWTPNIHHELPEKVRTWVYFVLLCGTASCREDHVTQRLPRLPPELWTLVLSNVVMGQYFYGPHKDARR
eukprot:m.86775 g.86775  ORF g.86775 m.86775 type:complete len:215 (+) comp11495_c0_seq1:81-725(+)